MNILFKFACDGESEIESEVCVIAGHIKQRIDLLDLHSFYNLQWLNLTVVAWMITLKMAAITDHVVMISEPGRLY